jgi:uncharacterized protein
VIVVIDSGVWISALAFGGTPDLAIQKAVGIDRVAVCDQIKNEIAKTLARKIGWDRSRLTQAFAIYFKDAIWVPITGLVRGVCRDPNDDAIIECALQAEAELIVSGDKDLLVIKNYKRIRIITPTQYIALPASKDL